MFQKITLSIFFLFLAQCKPDLNNPNDPKSSDFYLQLGLQSALVGNVCNNFSQFQFVYGDGSNDTRGTGILQLQDGNIAIFGFTKAPLVSGQTQGTNGAFTTAGVNQAYLMKVSGRTGEIIWIDYLGFMYDSISFLPKLRQFSNGDIAVAFITEGTEQNVSGGPLSNKSGSYFAVYVGRHAIDGRRRWYTYLDTPDMGNFLDYVLDTADNIHIFALLEETLGNTPFEEVSLTGTQVPTTGTDIAYLKLNGSGAPLRQSILESPANDFVNHVFLVGDAIFLSGTTAGNFAGTSQPFPGNMQPYIARISASTSATDWVSYVGGNVTFGGVEQLYGTPDSIYALIRTNGSWGTPVVSPVNDTYHYSLNEVRWDGGQGWHTFFGMTAFDIPAIESPPMNTDRSTGLLRIRTRVSPDQARYDTDLNLVTGSGAGLNQIADIFVNPISGTYQRVNYSSNLATSQRRRTDQILEVCGGNQFYYLNVLQPDSGTLPFQTELVSEIGLPTN